MAAASMPSFGRSHHSAIPALFFLLLFIFSGCGGDSSDGDDALGTDAGLAALELSSGTLSPEFDAANTQYTVQIVNAVDSLAVTATTADANAAITVNGEPVNSGAASEPIALVVGFNSIDIVVTAQDGVDTRTYTLAVERNSGFWSWVSGDNTLNQTGVYGEKGVADALNKPGARAFSLAWADGDGDLWLFGGLGYDGSATGYLGDLWKFDGNWSWVSGDNAVNQAGVYGAQGIAEAANKPGARSQSVGWT